MTALLAFVGSTTRTEPPKRAGKGIAICRFDDRTGSLSVVEELGGIDNPSWITVDRARHRLYASSEMGDWNEGAVAAYDFDPASGHLSYVNKQPTLGNSTCHLGLSPDGRWLAAANYAVKDTGHPDQSVALFALDDGELPPAISRVRHEGRGPNPDRQTRPHAHCAQFTPDSSLLLVVDLGLDRLFAYQIDELGQLVADPGRGFSFEPGRGPRHLAFHPDGQGLFVVHEVRCGITALRFEESLLRHVQTRDVVYGVLGQPSAIVVSPDGRHVYIAVRGPGEIVGFSVEAGGKLDEIGRWPCGGTWPRDMVLTPSGSHLLVCNQDADNVAVLARNGETGALGPANPALSTGTPMRLAFA